jgi:hypothetical protein
MFVSTFVRSNVEILEPVEKKWYHLEDHMADRITIKIPVEIST